MSVPFFRGQIQVKDSGCFWTVPHAGDCWRGADDRQRCVMANAYYRMAAVGAYRLQLAALVDGARANDVNRNHEGPVDAEVFCKPSEGPKTERTTKGFDKDESMARLPARPVRRHPEDTRVGLMTIRKVSMWLIHVKGCHRRLSSPDRENRVVWYALECGSSPFRRGTLMGGKFSTRPLQRARIERDSAPAIDAEHAWEYEASSRLVVQQTNEGRPAGFGRAEKGRRVDRVPICGEA
jgi:hypothetical protein